MDETTAQRPTKKQRELLTFIDNFIAGHGYGPSYREIMRGIGYKSVATVALHVENLIAKGLLIKKDKSARSLEVVGSKKEFKTNKVAPAQEKWLISQVGSKFDAVEALPAVTQIEVDELEVLVVALKILGFESGSLSFKDRLSRLNVVAESTE